MKRFLIILFSLGAAAFAQEPPVATGTYLERLLDIQGWLDQLAVNAEAYRGPITTISRALVILGVVASLVFFGMRRNGRGMARVLFRMLAVGALLALAPDISSLTYDTFATLSEWSTSQIQPIVDSGSEEMLELSSVSATVIAGLTVPGAGFALRGGVAAAVKTGASGALKRLFELLNLTVIPIAIFVLITHFIILLAGVTIAIANIFFPIAVAALMYSEEAGEKWLGAYVSGVAASLFVVTVLPLGFGAAFDVAVVNPIRIINENFASSEDLYNGYDEDPTGRIREIDAELEEIGREYSALAYQNSPDNGMPAIGDAETQAEWAALGRRAEELRSERTEVLEQLSDNVDGWFANTTQALAGALRNLIFMVLLLILGSFIGGYLMWEVTQKVANFAGGVAISGVSAMRSLGSGGRALSSGATRAAGKLGSGSSKALPGGKKELPASTPQVPRGPSSGGGRPAVGSAK